MTQVPYLLTGAPERVIWGHVRSSIIHLKYYSDRESLHAHSFDSLWPYNRTKKGTKIKSNNFSVRSDGSSVFGTSRRGEGARARRTPLHPKGAPYGRHWRDVSEEFFVVVRRLRAPVGAFRPEKHLEGLFVVGGRSWGRPPTTYIFPVKHSRLEGAEQSQRAPSAPKGGGGHGPVTPLPTPLHGAVGWNITPPPPTPANSETKGRRNTLAGGNQKLVRRMFRWVLKVVLNRSHVRSRSA